MKNLLLLLPIALCASCVTPGDLQNISASVGDLADAQEAFEAGTITRAEFQASVEETAEDVAQSVEDAVERSSGLVNAVKADPLSTILGVLTVMGGSVAGTNKLRNSARVKRGEAV